MKCFCWLISLWFFLFSRLFLLSTVFSSCFLCLSVANANEDAMVVGFALPRYHERTDEPAQYAEFAGSMAISMINNKTFGIPFDVLQHTNFSLVIEVNSTRDEEEDAIYSILSLSSRDTAVVIGDLTSRITEVCAYVANIKNIPILSPVASSPTFSDKSTFPHFSRVIPSDVSQAGVLISLFSELHWRKIAVIWSDEAYGRNFAETFFATSW
eukprot:Rmarinus@m.24117